MLLTFTIHSSVEIQDSYFDERFQLRLALRSIRASCFHTCFGPWQALRASIQFQGELRTWSFKVLNCLGLRLRALTRASGFHVRFSWCHQHWLGRSGTVSGRRHWLLEGAWTGRGRSGTVSGHRHWLLEGAWTGRGRATSPCPGSSVNESYIYIYCSYSNSWYCRQLAL